MAGSTRYQFDVKNLIFVSQIWLTKQIWVHICFQVGLHGEKKQIFTDKGSTSVQWTKPGAGEPLTWYKVKKKKNSLFLDVTNIHN